MLEIAAVRKTAIDQTEPDDWFTGQSTLAAGESSDTRLSVHRSQVIIAGVSVILITWTVANVRWERTVPVRVDYTSTRIAYISHHDALLSNHRHRGRGS